MCRLRRGVRVCISPRPYLAGLAYPLLLAVDLAIERLVVLLSSFSQKPAVGPVESADKHRETHPCTRSYQGRRPQS